jgi:hypothetical protein
MFTINNEKSDPVTTAPFPTETPSGYFCDVRYKSDGITPDFDELFAALAEEERTAPPLETVCKF